MNETFYLQTALQCGIFDSAFQHYEHTNTIRFKKFESNFNMRYVETYGVLVSTAWFLIFINLLYLF